mgnify:CR=1 FL=1
MISLISSYYNVTFNSGSSPADFYKNEISKNDLITLTKSTNFINPLFIITTFLMNKIKIIIPIIIILINILSQYLILNFHKKKKPKDYEFHYKIDFFNNIIRDSYKKSFYTFFFYGVSFLYEI